MLEHKKSDDDTDEKTSSPDGWQESTFRARNFAANT